jgi:hypothetical protein
MELVIYQPTEEQFFQSIEFNHESIKQELAVRLEKYNGLVYSDDSIKEAKADRATLNKFKEAIENKRKEIKKQCLKPYEDFETKIKDIVAMIDKPILAIDGQVKAYEKIKKDEKLQAIETFYLDKVMDLKDIVPFDRVFNQKWLNTTYKETDIHKEINDLFLRVESDLAVLGELESEYEAQLKDFYLKNYDLTATLQENKRLKEQAEKLAEYNRQQEEKKRIAKEQAEKAKAEREVNRPQPTTETKVVTPEKPAMEMIRPPKQEAALIIIDFRVTATAEQLNELKQFLNSNGIKYGRVPEQAERKVV